ncbi:restriction endonuclease subunit S [Metamycoplasma hyosynoviae]|uniref:restriction endonuclease subunit S n=3 Tax=Metamycoplasma hyosynoviae TaxID=29559 RepID=UPI0020C90AE7|nr:restriction endonuclease subunit S [Metamycoplasma hyosynoviae]UTO27591.1 restriction endonuclease subunit S [Metamycoplasma hyosynoviae]
MNYLKIRNLSHPQKGFYGIGASATEYNDQYPQYLRITDIDDNCNVSTILPTCVDINVYPKWNQYLLKVNDIVFARTGNSTGRNYFCKKIKKDTVFAGFLVKFSINPELVIPNYVGYYCQSPSYWKQIRAMFIGSTRANINAKQYADLLIPIVDRTNQHHIVNTIGSVDNLIENYQERINKICNILFISLKKYTEKISIKYYEPKIIKSGITKFDKTKIYIDTSKIEGINNMSNGNIITFNKRPSRANMQPIKNSVWFAKMKESNKKLIITENDFDLINDYILSTGYLGVEASSKIPLSLLLGIIISSDFNEQRDLNSVGTTMAGINNETFLNILVPKLSDDEILKYDKNYHSFINELSLLRKKINELRVIKSKLLEKYF